MRPYAPPPTPPLSPRIKGRDHVRKKFGPYYHQKNFAFSGNRRAEKGEALAADIGEAAKAFPCGNDYAALPLRSVCR